MASTIGSVFVRTLLQDKVKIIPSLLGKNLEHVILNILRKKYEAKCSQYGYIKTDSLAIYKYSMGSIIAPSLNGDIQFTVQFYAHVFNPVIGQIIKAKVVNANKFGILAECESFVEIIIAKNTSTLTSDIDLNTVNIGDVINVEILGKKYELNDKKISIVGRAVQDISTPSTTSKIRKISRVVDKTEDLNGENVDDPEFEDDDSEEDEDEDEEDEEDKDEDEEDEVEEEVEEDVEEDEEADDDKEENVDEFAGDDLDASDIGGDDLDDGASSVDDA